MHWARIVIVAGGAAAALGIVLAWPVWRGERQAAHEARIAALRADGAAKRAYLAPCDAEPYMQFDELFRAQLGGPPAFSVIAYPAFHGARGAAAGLVGGQPILITFVYPDPIDPPRPDESHRGTPTTRRVPIPRALFDALQDEWQRSTADTWRLDRDPIDGIAHVYRHGAHCGIESDAVPGSRTWLLADLAEALYRYEGEAQVQKALDAVPALPALR